MEMSRAASYAFHALAYMAQMKTNNPVQSHRIAEERGIPKRFLLKVLKPLVDARILDSVKGPSGGYRLARGAGETRISDIILAVDEPIRATRCAPGAPVGCRGNKSRCLTHDLWEELGNQIHLYLSSVSLADVVERRVLGSSGVGLPAPRDPAVAAQ